MKSPFRTAAETCGAVDASSSGSPAGSPGWLQVDQAAEYMGGVSRKTVYAAVAAGMRVSRLSDEAPKRDSRGRLNQGRMLFSTQWIDEFLRARSRCAPLGERVTTAGKSLNSQREHSREESEIATRLQRDTENRPEVAPCAD
jgi:hypothetical protein